MAFYSSSYIFCFLTITFIFLNSVDSQAYYQPNAVHPDYPNKCYFEGPPVTVLNVGQTKRLSRSCFKLSCGEGFGLQVLGCGVYGTNDHCRVVKGDLSRPYPDCCDELVC